MTMTPAQKSAHDLLWEIKWRFDDVFGDVNMARRCEFRDAVVSNVQNAALLVKDSIKMLNQDTGNE